MPKLKKNQVYLVCKSGPEWCIPTWSYHSKMKADKKAEEMNEEFTKKHNSLSPTNRVSFWEVIHVKIEDSEE